LSHVFEISPDACQVTIGGDRETNVIVSRRRHTRFLLTSITAGIAGRSRG
jgi:hypothetical protein